MTTFHLAANVWCEVYGLSNENAYHEILSKSSIIKHVYFYGTIEMGKQSTFGTRPYQMLLCPADVEKWLELVAGTAYKTQKSTKF